MKSHRVGLIVLAVVLGLAVMPAFAQGPFPPPVNYAPAAEGMHSTYSGAIGGYQYARAYFDSMRAASEMTNYGWQFVGVNQVPRAAGGGAWITAARAAQSSAPVMALGFMPTYMYGYSQQMMYDRACSYATYGCGPQ